MGHTLSFLMIQFRTDAGKELEQISVKEKFALHGLNDAHIRFIDAFDEANAAVFASPVTLLEDVQGVILGGSSEFYFGGNTTPEYEAKHEAMLLRVAPCIHYILENDFPTLGICFGHQMLAYFLGQKVLADKEQSETGSLSVTLSEKGRGDTLFQDMPEAWRAFFVHRDSVMSVPEEAVVLGSGERSRIGAFRFKEHIYGVQFHPELDKHDLPPRLLLHPEYVTGGIDAFMESIEEVPEASRVLKNFANICQTVIVTAVATQKTLS